MKKSSADLKHILITGLAGSGKSTVCRKLQDLGYEAYDIESIEGLYTMLDQETGEAVSDYDNNDLEQIRNSKWACDLDKLQELLKQTKHSPAFFCGIAANLDEILPFFDKMFLLSADSETLRDRLSSRKPGEFANTKEVQDWLIETKPEVEKDLIDQGAQIIDANPDIETVTSAILRDVKKQI